MSTSISCGHCIKCCQDSHLREIGFCELFVLLDICFINKLLYDDIPSLQALLLDIIMNTLLLLLIFQRNQ